jgi:hypothetical protein
MNQCEPESIVVPRKGLRRFAGIAHNRPDDTFVVGNTQLSTNIVNAWRTYNLEPPTALLEKRINVVDFVSAMFLGVRPLFPTNVRIAASLVALDFVAIGNGKNGAQARIIATMKNAQPTRVYPPNVGSHVVGEQFRFAVEAGSMNERVFLQGDACALLYDRRSGSENERFWGFERYVHPTCQVFVALPLRVHTLPLPVGMLVVSYLGDPSHDAEALERFVTLMSNATDSKRLCSMACRFADAYLRYRLRGEAVGAAVASSDKLFDNNKKGLVVLTATNVCKSVTLLEVQDAIHSCIAPMRVFVGEFARSERNWRDGATVVWKETMSSGRGDVVGSSNLFEIVDAPAVQSGWRAFAPSFVTGVSNVPPEHSVLIACLPFNSRDFLARHANALKMMSCHECDDRCCHVILVSGSPAAENRLAASDVLAALESWPAFHDVPHVVISIAASTFSFTPLQRDALHAICTHQPGSFQGLYFQQKRRLI